MGDDQRHLKGRRKLVNGGGLRPFGVALNSMGGGKWVEALDVYIG